MRRPQKLWSGSPVAVRLVIVGLVLNVVIGAVVVVGSNLDKGLGAWPAVAATTWLMVVMLGIVAVLGILLLRRSGVGWVLTLLWGLSGLARSPDSTALRVLSLAVTLLIVLPLFAPTTWRWVWRKEEAAGWPPPKEADPQAG